MGHSWGRISFGEVNYGAKMNEKEARMLIDDIDEQIERRRELMSIFD